MTPPFRKARSKVFFPVPDNWEPNPEEKAWLEEIEALTEDEENQLARFDAGTMADVDIWDEETETWVRGDKL